VKIYAVEILMKEGDQKATPRVLTRAGERFGVATGAWRLDMSVRQGETRDTVWLAGKLYKDKELVSAPTLLARVGEAATVKVGEGEPAFTMSMTVTPQS
ncbi:MAG: hypothetical protein ACREWI_04010, partial [Telluria sp.]